MTIFTESGWIERKRFQNRKRGGGRREGKRKSGRERVRAQDKRDLSKKTIFGVFIKMKGLGSVLEALEVKGVKNIL